MLTLPESASLETRVSLVREALNTASEGRYPAPRLIAVTKTHAPEVFLPLADMGVDTIGENRVQEIREKLPVLADRFQVHMIGRLQTNKVKYIMEGVSMIQSLDRMELALEIDRQAQKHQVTMPVLVEISPAGEQQKGGLPPEELEQFLKNVAPLQGLRVQGLMAVMPLDADEETLARLFQNMRTLFERTREKMIPGIEMKELSMGMSHDFLLAARYGATMVRIGSLLFGKRNYPAPS